MSKSQGRIELHEVMNEDNPLRTSAIKERSGPNREKSLVKYEKQIVAKVEERIKSDQSQLESKLKKANDEKTALQNQLFSMLDGLSDGDFFHL
jgi:hypothetical protein